MIQSSPYLAVLLLISLFSCSLSAQKVDMSVFHGISPRNIGPAGMSGRVTSIDVELSDLDQILIGTAAGGIWKSENRGHTWQPIFENELAASIGAVTIFQANPDIIYVGTGEGNPRNSQNSGWGMYKSMDGGKNWQHLGLEKTRQIHRVIVHPENPDVVVIGAAGATWGPSPDRGVYRSDDGGTTWRQVLYVNDRTGVSDLVVDPQNPNKMFAAMYEHRRWPWFYQSGGPGSGIFQSLDGGNTWNPITSEQGLPAGELGRIGLSIAPSDPNYIYAYIESADNAIWRSTDGGESWVRRSKSKDKNIGGRPFYYADLYVDTQNPNRVYSIATEVTVTKDGGATWSVFAPGNRIHTDHHAWWSHPDDAEYLMIGHDGGLNITHDRGKNWWFPDNLPLAQFYHIRVDNAIPYNVMGGLQDNGSWRGPSQTWFKGGIRNMYWQRLSVGDGFDVVPDPLNNDYGYAMGQAGNLVRWHAPSGHLKKIKPTHPEGEYLRFNWNTGIAIDPHDQKTIYYGSQYLHRSSDYGNSWDIISPDLTTNDPKKQKFLESGGLSFDVTGAEFHTTIITIDPSPVKSGVIWVGTDDGNIQITQDAGQSWTNVTKNLKGVPTHTWVTQISASTYDAAEAFAVLEDHRRDNWEPYVYRTRDYGKTWTRLVDAADVRGYTFCLAQDPVVPNLLFVGTEFGLYVSFDGGSAWNKWTNDLPTMPITDLVIHPREHDLVIGTFGRSIWIMDDIRSLRALAKDGVNTSMAEEVSLFPMPDARLMVIGESHGYRQGKIGDALYNGENRPYGALLTYYLKTVEGPTNTLTDKVRIDIADEDGNIIRTFYQAPKVGINRTAWSLKMDAARYPRAVKPQKNKQKSAGFYAAPGTYQVTVSYKGNSDKGLLKVLPDSRFEVSKEAIDGKMMLIQRQNELTDQVTAMMDEIRDIEKRIGLVKETLLVNKTAADDPIFNLMAEVLSETSRLKEQVIGKEVQGIYRDPAAIESMIFASSYLLDHPLSPPSPNQENQQRLLEQAIREFSQQLTVFKEEQLSVLIEALKRFKTSLFPR